MMIKLASTQIRLKPRDYRRRNKKRPMEILASSHILLVVRGITTKMRDLLLHGIKWKIKTRRLQRFPDEQLENNRRR